MLTCSILIALVSLASSHGDGVIHGKCPELSPAENFDINRYAAGGPWYGIYYSGEQWSNWYRKWHCPEEQLQYDAENNSLRQDRYHVNDSVPVYRDRVVEQTQPGVLRYPQSVQDAKTEWWYKMPTKVVLTDYDNYAVQYGCYDLEKGHYYEYAVIYSRQRFLDSKYYDVVREYFQRHIPDLVFHPVDVRDCRVKCTHLP